MRKLMIGVAIAALCTVPAAAKPGNGQGGGQGNGKSAGAPAASAGSPAKSNARQAPQSANRSDAKPAAQKQVQKQAAAEKRASSPSVSRAPAGAAVDKPKGNSSAAKLDRAPQAKATRNGPQEQPKAPVAASDKGKAARAIPAAVTARGDGAPGPSARIYRDRNEFDGFFARAPQRGALDGCPPGLAKKNNGCLPPGQAKKLARPYYAEYRPNWWGVPRVNGDYYYRDGYLLRFGNTGIASYIPLLGGALSVGNVWPTRYSPYTVSPYYSSYYGLGPDGGYRYADNAFYRVDPQTQAITAIAALLTGNDIAIGSPMPAGYDVYNVPYPYRSQYVDGPGGYYRYSDGYIYQVDPETRLVAAAIELALD
ncbi:MAG: hypothetical protein IE933_08580 [Sphingomonadales bacterium]|nr:hypothetical protein [Sphingomonadales bacterium]MBD3773606.1 hypothetical protein [Paracoccaceae bacterium]